MNTHKYFSGNLENMLFIYFFIYLFIFFTITYFMSTQALHSGAYMSGHLT